MAPSEVLDALTTGRFIYLEPKDGAVYGGAPLTVNYCADEDLADACIEVTEWGLILHFNTRAAGETLGVTVPLTNIAVVR